MSNEQEDKMEAALRSMSQWDDPSRQLWKKALEQVAGDDGSGSKARPRVWRRPIAQKWIGVAAMILLVVVVVSVMLPATGKARRSAPRYPARAAENSANLTAPQAGDFVPMFADGPSFDINSILQSSGGRGGGGGDSPFIDPDTVMRQFSTPKGMLPFLNSFQQEQTGTAPSRMPAIRAVARKVTIELEVEDARTAYIKARSLISEASGEFIQGGQLGEQSGRQRADLILRVRAERLDEVLMALRELGKVHTERLDAEDVTEQMVDLGARLKNERSIEAELLQLLASRPDDDLDDILKVRRELAKVREQIERIDAGRSRLSGLVQLATVTVLITETRVEPEPEPEPEKIGLWGQFVLDLGEAGKDGVESLLGIAVGLTRVAIAGLPVWLGIAFVSIFGWRLYRRANPKPLPA
jgi:Domain of unknown function (DUF4349)